MEKKIVLTGIARSKGKAKGEAMVFSHRFGWAFNHVGNEDGKILTAGWDHLGKFVTGKIVVYPTRDRLHQRRRQPVLQGQAVTSTAPRPSSAEEVFPFDISGAIAAEIPAVDKLDQDPITTIKNGDMVEIDAPAGRPEGHRHHYP